MPVFIVEGFFDCIHVTVYGFDCVALMGNSISTYQLKLLKEMGTVILGFWLTDFMESNLLVI